MIPKTIHYIWLGGKPKPALTNICILSWREKNPDYDIIEWNETNLDIERFATENRFFAACRKRHMWAYMADYIRLKILYEYGGIYLDTDMLVLRSLDAFLDNEAFMGEEDSRNIISCGIMGFIKGHSLLQRVLEFYQDQIWCQNIWTIPSIITSIIRKNCGYSGLRIYDQVYFYPYPYNQVFDLSFIKENSYTIHWWTESWNRSIGPYVFLTTKHIQNPIVRFFKILLKIAGFCNRRRKQAGLRLIPEVFKISRLVTPTKRWFTMCKWHMRLTLSFIAGVVIYFLADRLHFKTVIGKRYKKLMIVVHPDDETLFFSDVLMSEGKDLVVFCLTNGYDFNRRSAFYRAISFYGVAGHIMKMPDQTAFSFLFNDKSVYKVIKKIRKVCPSCDTIYTHNMEGDYGHPHHRLVGCNVAKVFYDAKIIVPVSASDMDNDQNLLPNRCLRHKEYVFEHFYDSQVKGVKETLSLWFYHEKLSSRF